VTGPFRRRKDLEWWTGAFARLASYYTDSTGKVDYQQLVRHLATNAADAYGLHGRGRIGVGRAADLTILDQAGIVDTAGYEDPRDLAGGVALVLVNGTVVWQNEHPTGDGHPGAVVRL
jgi:N-acyl-D-amino-acid deacylase